MRLLHPETLRIVSMVCKDEDFEKATSSRKQIISHAWSEMLKFKATKQSHPKMFIHDEYEQGLYMKIVYTFGKVVGCNLDPSHLEKYQTMNDAFTNGTDDWESVNKHFDSNYLFSDAVSLYFKGVNIFKYVFGDEWRKFVPVESLEEIHRQVSKSLNKEKY
jgi:hypothetical protein